MTTKTVPAGLAGLADLQPTIATEPSVSTKALAETHGFVERNPLVPRKRRMPVDEPIHSFTARVSVRAADRFIEWCERERISYREGFDRLVASIDKA